VAEGDVVGHLDGDTSGEGTDLLMDVHEECARFPATHFLDRVWVNAVEVHRHGSASPEGVAADVAFGVAEFVEANVGSGPFEGGVDVLGGDGSPGGIKWVGEIEEAGGWGALVLQDVVDASGQRLDRTVDISSAFLMDALAFDAVLLVRHADGCFCGGEEH